MGTKPKVDPPVVQTPPFPPLPPPGAPVPGPGVAVIHTSAGEGDGSPIPFYESYGFERTGDIVFHNEVLLRLRIR